MADDEITRLTQQVADYLSNRRGVIIRWADPPASASLGQSFRTLDNRAVIYICPRIGLDARFGVFLHELWHCRADWEILPLINPSKKAAHINRTDGERQAWSQSPREQKALEMQGVWSDYADTQAWKYKKGNNSWMEARLLALLHWKP